MKTKVGYIATSEGGVYIYGEEKISQLIALIQDVEDGETRIAGSVIPTYIDMVMDAVPFVYKEKVYAEAVMIGEGKYKVIFKSRGEPSEQVSRVIKDKGTGQFFTVQETPSLDASVLAVTEEAIIRTEPEREDVIESTAALYMQEAAARRGLRLISTGKYGYRYAGYDPSGKFRFTTLEKAASWNG